MRSSPLPLLLVANVTGKALSFFANSLAIAWLFGANRASDALLVAQVIPAFLVTVFAFCGQSAIVPVLIELREREGVARARRLAGAVLAAGVPAALVFGGALFLAVPEGISLLAPGFDEARTLEARELARVMHLGIPLAAISSLLNGLLLSGRRFRAPALAIAAGPAAQLATLALLHRSHGIEAAALAFVAIPVAELLVLLPGLLGAGLVSFKAVRVRDDALGKMLRLALPGAAGSVTYALFLLVYRAAATTLDGGELTALDYATKLAQGIPVLLAAALGTALLPELSAHAARREHDALAEKLSRGIGRFAAIAAPILVACLLFGDELSQSLFSHGRFPDEKLAVLSLSLAALSPVALALGIGQLCDQALFARQSARSVWFASVTGLTCALAFALPLLSQLGVLALALGLSLSYVIKAGIGLLLLRRQLEGTLQLRALLSVTARPLLLALACGAVAHAGATLFLRGAPLLFVEALVAASLYVFAAPLVGVEAVSELRLRAFRASTSTRS